MASVLNTGAKLGIQKDLAGRLTVSPKNPYHPWDNGIFPLQFIIKIYKNQLYKCGQIYHTYMGGMGIVSQQDFEMDDMKMLTPICPKQYPSTCFFAYICGRKFQGGTTNSIATVKGDRNDPKKNRDVDVVALSGFLTSRSV